MGAMALPCRWSAARQAATAVGQIRRLYPSRRLVGGVALVCRTWAVRQAAAAVGLARHVYPLRRLVGGVALYCRKWKARRVGTAVRQARRVYPFRQHAGGVPRLAQFKVHLVAAVLVVALAHSLQVDLVQAVVLRLLLNVQVLLLLCLVAAGNLAAVWQMLLEAQWVRCTEITRIRASASSLREVHP